ncbi:hypothetical protein AG1IA_09544 [Rhizoctonia solani AG-1 IA]|uniref:Uncharacterized protein n=1 Tax=Thanatephorus cucumeris (strain AG1-IA) TaxID=983506 RepID=L8WI78_THACA|nr:hypothetical protein AG1IA_09544 [Rhizoctonia solani AG-1 IA]
MHALACLLVVIPFLTGAISAIPISPASSSLLSSVSFSFHSAHATFTRTNLKQQRWAVQKEGLPPHPVLILGNKLSLYTHQDALTTTGLSVKIDEAIEEIGKKGDASRWAFKDELHWENNRCNEERVLVGYPIGKLFDMRFSKRDTLVVFRIADYDSHAKQARVELCGVASPYYISDNATPQMQKCAILNIVQEF